MARGLNLRFENLDEQKKVDRNEVLFNERVRHLENRAAQNGIAVVKRRNGEPDFGERRQSEVELFSRYVHSEGGDSTERPVGELMYRYLSGHVHSAIWVKVSNAEVTSTDEPGMSSMKLDMQFSWLAAILSMLLRVHERNILSLLGLSGYPSEVWEETKKTARADALGRLERLHTKEPG